MSFKSYEIKDYLGYKEEKYNYNILIIDDDFQETPAIAAAAGAWPLRAAAAGAAAVIKVYKKRNLNVAANLFLLFQYIENKYPWSVKSQIKYCQEYIPEFREYEKDIQKYMSLL